MIWDFDKTLIKGYSQDPIFAKYGIDAKIFWGEVNSLQELYRSRGLLVGADTAYLLHMLSYVEHGVFGDLTNSELVKLGSEIEMSTGMPEFLPYISGLIAEEPRYKSHGLTLEHYVVSTGIRHLIQGSAVGEHITKIWANEFVDQLPPPGYDPSTHEFDDVEGPIAQVGYMIDNTSKTRAIFEINKGPEFDVNARVDESDRRIPIRNMVYIADGPSDVPVFSVLKAKAGRCLGVYQNERNYPGVKQLADEGRVDSIEQANFTDGTGAHLWLTTTAREIADRICDERDTYFGTVGPPAGHIV